MSKRILVIGDAHNKPGVSNERFTWLGKLIVDAKPDYVVDIGDFVDMSSLCSFDKGKGSFTSRRYKEDIENSHDARSRIWTVVRRQKRKLPKFFSLIGNHEERILRAIEKDPVTLEGIIGIKDLGYKEYRWELRGSFGLGQFEPLEIEGVAFNHAWPTGISGKPISSENPANTMLKKNFKSCVAGHSHLLDFSMQNTISGRTLVALVAGCFLAPEQHEEWAGLCNKLWWRGICILDNVEDGYFDLTTININQIKRTYS